MKHVVHRLPAPIWSGQGRSRAEHILALIEEAGGRGKIVETGGDAPPAASPAGPADPAKSAKTDKSAKSKLACRWCGFPMKEDETRCGFCMMAVGNVERSAHTREPAERSKGISRKRIVFYAVILILGIIIAKLLTR